eukprot:1194563-Prorocentrum_minimum.AAC.3
MATDVATYATHEACQIGQSTQKRPVDEFYQIAQLRVHRGVECWRAQIIVKVRAHSPGPLTAPRTLFFALARREGAVDVGGSSTKGFRNSVPSCHDQRIHERTVLLQPVGVRVLGHARRAEGIETTALVINHHAWDWLRAECDAANNRTTEVSQTRCQGVPG